MKLKAQWIVGFVDGEGCFHLDVHVHKSMNWGLQMQPEFTVVQNEVDIQVLHALKDSFQCGGVTLHRKDKNGTRYHFRVKNVEHLHTKIIPFFEKHSLKTKRNVEFRTFRKIVRLMYEDYHRTSLQNFLEIVDLGKSLRLKNTAYAQKQNKQGMKVAEIVENLRQKQANPLLLQEEINKKES